MVHYSVFLGSVVGKRKKKRKGRKGEVGGTKGVRMIGRSVFHRVHKEQTARRGWILKAYRLEFNKENPPLEIDNRNAGIILLLHSALPVVLLGKKKKKEKKKKRNSSKCDSIQSRSPLGRRPRPRTFCSCLKSESNSRKFLDDDSYIEISEFSIWKNGEFKLFFIRVI